MDESKPSASTVSNETSTVPDKTSSVQTETASAPKGIAAPPNENATEPAQRPRGGRWWKWLVLGAILAACVVVYLIRQNANQASKAKAAPPPAPLSIGTVAARKGDIGVYINAFGTVTPVYTVSVTARVTGAIDSVNYREGQVVHKGDVLLEIDPRPYQAQLTQYEGQLAHDQALLSEARIDLEPLPGSVQPERDRQTATRRSATDCLPGRRNGKKRPGISR